MAFKKTCLAALLSIGLFGMLTAEAQETNPFGQTFQINTHLNSFVGKPSWLIIVRDVETGQVLPYLYTFEDTENFWLGFTFAHAYQVMVSEIQFGPPNCIIHNFCHLQDGILDRESFTVNLTGDLTPNRFTASCHVFKYKQFPFPIVESAGDSSDQTSSSSGSSALPASLPSLPGAAGAISSTVSSALNSSVAGNIGSLVGNALTGNHGK